MKKALRSIITTHCEQHQQLSDSKLNLCWFTATPELFLPGYQRLSYTGKSFIPKVINAFLGHYLAYIKIKSTTTIIEKIKSTYFAPLVSIGLPIPERDSKRFLSILNHLLIYYWKDIHSWTYTELFSCLNACCRLFFNTLELPSDLYTSQKKIQTEYGIRIYQEIRELVLDQTIDFDLLVYLTIRANWIDNYDQDPSAFLQSFLGEIGDILDKKEWLADLVSHTLYFQIDALKQDLASAPKHILYEVDNHGEIFLDLLFIEWLLIHNHTVTISTKKSPVLNDVCCDDFMGLLKLNCLTHLSTYVSNKKLTIIDNGSTNVVALRQFSSTTYQECYSHCDCVILKGQGHFESYPLKRLYLTNKKNIYYHKRHYHLFGLKSNFTLSSCRYLFKDIQQFTPLLLCSEIC